MTGLSASSSNQHHITLLSEGQKRNKSLQSQRAEMWQIKNPHQTGWRMLKVTFRFTPPTAGEKSAGNNQSAQ